MQVTVLILKCRVTMQSKVNITWKTMNVKGSLMKILKKMDVFLMFLCTRFLHK